MRQVDVSTCEVHSRALRVCQTALSARKTCRQRQYKTAPSTDTTSTTVSRTLPPDILFIIKSARPWCGTCFGRTFPRATHVSASISHVLGEVPRVPSMVHSAFRTCSHLTGQNCCRLAHLPSPKARLAISSVALRSAAGNNRSNRNAFSPCGRWAHLGCGSRTCPCPR